jgi:hypothetical protein
LAGTGRSNIAFSEVAELGDCGVLSAANFRKCWCDLKLERTLFIIYRFLLILILRLAEHHRELRLQRRRAQPLWRPVQSPISRKQECLMSIFGTALDASTGRWIAFNEETLTSLSDHDTGADALEACRRYLEREVQRANILQYLTRQAA